MYKGSIIIAIKTPPRCNVTVIAAPIAPIKLKLGVPSNKPNNSTQIWPEGILKVRHKSGENNVKSKPVAVQ